MACLRALQRKKRGMMTDEMRSALMLGLCLWWAGACGVDAWSIGVVQCGVESAGSAVELGFSGAEMLAAFSSVFKMSDGSTLSGAGGVENLPLRNTMSMLGDVGVQVNGTVGTIQICEGDLLRLAMLAALGNFVNAPGDHPGEIATVAVDVYNGKIVLVPPYSALREYFLETLLVISVLVIARLAFVRKMETKFLERGQLAKAVAEDGVRAGVMEIGGLFQRRGKGLH